MGCSSSKPCTSSGKLVKHDSIKVMLARDRRSHGDTKTRIEDIDIEHSYDYKPRQSHPLEMRMPSKEMTPIMHREDTGSTLETVHADSLRSIEEGSMGGR